MAKEFLKSGEVYSGGEQSCGESVAESMRDQGLIAQGVLTILPDLF